MLPPLCVFYYFILVGRSTFLEIKSEQQQINLVWPYTWLYTHACMCVVMIHVRHKDVNASEDYTFRVC